MSLPILSADQRQTEKRGSKIVIFGASGMGKTSLLHTLPADTTLFVDLEAGDLAVQDWRGDTFRPQTWPAFRDFVVFLGGPNPALRDVQVGVFAVSSPRVFCGQESRDRVQSILGTRNIFRFNVHYDPVTQMPPRSLTGYRSVGVLLLDCPKDVWRRADTAYPDQRTWINRGLAMHYASNARLAGNEFNGRLLPQSPDALRPLLEASQQHDPDLFEGPSFYGCPNDGNGSPQ